jgi:hypothetical protein
MRLYTLYTPSHKVFYKNYFLKTVPKEFKIIKKEIKKQICSTGVYDSTGWEKVTYEKVKFFHDICKENLGKIFFYCDVDVNFFKKSIIEELIFELSDYDIACQNDVIDFGMYSSGVFVCRANKDTLNLFSLMKNNFYLEDQTTLNNFIKICKPKLLSDKFFTIRHIIKTDNWTKSDDRNKEVKINKKILVHHANWTRGIKNKINLLEFVRNNIKTQNAFL